ncbi:hypothetical protein M408DRAFT_329166 [Serendipita vermifera MAFF 305830]|uniref:AB hydrolase-1 domain-containing protein n=1 Tax=Serendipita vermifera MAFF 305830 TaxID=933852 RepID=A0A0C3B9D0_SERVB|nr:hypothetical protein M408DRAFT_329166 [Serendipita vermifera MAFF 305830]
MPFVTLDLTSRIFYLIYGGRGEELDTSKPTILLLHPRFFDHEILATQYTDSRLRNDYNLVVIDLHYHGETEVVVDDSQFDYAKIADDIFRVLDSLGVSSCHLFGTSLGALIAIRMAFLHSQRVLSLTLCGTLPPEENSENMTQFRAILDLAMHKDEEGADRMPREMVVSGQLIYFGKWTPPDLVRWDAKSKFVPSNGKLLKKVYSALLDRKAPPKSEWQKITMPVLMIHGGEDIQYPPEVGRLSYDLLPSSTPKSFHVIEGAPHLFAWTHPEVVNKLFADFLRSHGAIA